MNILQKCQKYRIKSAKLTRRKRNSIIETFHPLQIWDRIILKNSRFHLICYFYMLGMKRTVRNWRGEKRQARAVNKKTRKRLHRGGERNEIWKKDQCSNCCLLRYYGLNSKNVSWYLCFSYWVKNTQRSGSGSLKFYWTTLSLSLLAEPWSSAVSIIHKVTFPCLPKPNTEISKRTAR